MNKLKWLRLVLRLSAIFQAFYWGGSHLFFPDWYLGSVGVTEPAQGFLLVTMHEIGLLSLGMALGTWLLARDPVGNLGLLVVLLFVAVGSAVLSTIHILTSRMPPGEWVTVIVLFVQVAWVIYLYPWRAAVHSGGEIFHSS